MANHLSITTAIEIMSELSTEELMRIAAGAEHTIEDPATDREKALFELGQKHQKKMGDLIKARRAKNANRIFKLRDEIEDLEDQMMSIQGDSVDQGLITSRKSKSVLEAINSLTA